MACEIMKGYSILQQVVLVLSATFRGTFNIEEENTERDLEGRLTHLIPISMAMPQRHLKSSIVQAYVHLIVHASSLTNTYCILTFRSTSSWKPGNVLISPPVKTSSHSMHVSRPIKISS